MDPDPNMQIISDPSGSTTLQTNATDIYLLEQFGTIETQNWSFF
jgi:hypothetical protein